jgi:hypothetical protein
MNSDNQSQDMRSLKQKEHAEFYSIYSKDKEVNPVTTFSNLLSTRIETGNINEVITIVNK